MQLIQYLLRILNLLYFVSVPSSVTHSIFSFLHFLFSRRSCVGERHSPSPSVRIRFSVFVEDSKESAAAAAANFGGLHPKKKAFTDQCIFPQAVPVVARFLRGHRGKSRLVPA